MEVSPGRSRGLAVAAFQGADLEDRKLRTADTAQLLEDLPGQPARRRRAFQPPRADGMADDRLKILVDGAPATAAAPTT